MPWKKRDEPPAQSTQIARRPPVVACAAELWEYRGVRCATARGFEAWLGFVELPAPLRSFLELPDTDAVVEACLAWDRRVETHGEIGYVDYDGWIGFGTSHYCCWWPQEELDGFCAQGLHVAAIKERINQDTLGKMGMAHRWSKVALRDMVNDLAGQVADLIGMP